LTAMIHRVISSPIEKRSPAARLNICMALILKGGEPQRLHGVKTRFNTYKPIQLQPTATQDHSYI
ncbi:MAG: hypothetical protein J6D44_08590, partial [Pseudomonas sp.]|nr:hypothetical protein [Pseudomonas sp.]